MHRQIDWEERIVRYLEPLRARPYEWAKNDCCTFAAGAVEAMTGVDPMAEFRGRYATARGAVRAIRRIGAGTLPATLDAKFRRIEAALAQRGDVVWIDDGSALGSLGLCWGPAMIAVGQQDERVGLIQVPRALWRDPIGWRVEYAA
ncbi:MAG: hypothetical protein PGN09_07705 [Sphingomonas fennica]